MTMRRLAGILLLLLLGGTVFAQSTDAPPAFDATDVHVSPARRFPFREGGLLRGDRYVLRQATMLDLISTAYDTDASNVQGGPIWLETDRFDVIAKAPAGTAPATLKLMLRTVLADRFKLVTHTGTKPMPAFLLKTGKGPTKLKEAEGSGDADCKFQEPAQPPGPGTVFFLAFSCHHSTMEAFAQNVHNWARDYLADPVVDSTGLKGSWDFDIRWNPKQMLAKAGPDGISIFDAVAKLGLKLETETAPRPVLIVDSVNQRPTANAPDLAKILPPSPPPQFDVAVIKPSKPDTRLRARINGGQVDLEGGTLKFIIAFAWDLNPSDDEALVGAPKWLDSDHFDILAKAVSDAPGSGGSNAPRIDIEELRQMMQALLEDRFKMKAHMEDRPISAYTLIAVKPKLTPADPTSRTRCKEGPGPDGKDPRITNPMLNRLMTCQNMNTAQIGDELQRIASGYIYGPVLDATGLKGSWDFTLSFSSADLTKGGPGPGGGAPPGAPAPSGTATASDPNGAVSLFNAVSKQLGLKLEKQRRPAPVLVIDHIEEQPTEN